MMGLATIADKRGCDVHAECLYKKILAKDPHRATTAIALGNLYIRHNRLIDAEHLFNQFIDDLDAKMGLAKIASKRGCTIRAEYLYKDILYHDPTYQDAGIALGNLYLGQNRLLQAEYFFSCFQDNIDAQIGLGTIAFRQGNDCRAIQIFRRVLAKDPCREEGHLGLARALAKQRQYTEAKYHYSLLSDINPRNEDYWKALFDVKSHTNEALLLEGNYTVANETDPTIGVPTVKDYYLSEAAHLLLPINDQWRLDFKQFFYHQKESDLIPPIGTNYNINENGGQITASYFFAKDWKLDLVTRAFYAHGNGEEEFPFQNTTRVEPGAVLLYNSDLFMFAAESHLESFIIKNFSVTRSQLLVMGVVEAGYGLHPDCYLKPEIEIWLGRNFYHDNLQNYKDFQTGLARFQLPLLPEGFSAHYFLEHGHFKALSINYFTYKQQLRNTIGIRYRKEFCSKGYFELLCEHRWQMTRDLVQPIGTLIFVAARQLLVGNRITSRVGYRLKDKWSIELEAHYYEDNLPYNEWNGRGSLLYSF